MTTEQNHETIGSLIARHKTSRERIRNLRGPYQELTRQLRDLGMMANDRESTIRVTPEGFTSGFEEKAIPLNILHAFAETVGELQTVREEKQRIETCLKEIGMANYIPREENTN